jgi:predicted nucleotidyltransferase
MATIDRNVSLPRGPIIDFCRRWHISELAVFGSALRDDFNPDSDLDILVAFAPEADWSLLDHVRMEQELAALLGRKIDLLSKQAVEQSHNWIRRKEILDSAEVIYASR